MPSISRNNSETDFIEEPPETVKHSVDKALEYLTTFSMTKMKLLQLYKLSKLSSDLDVKLYLNETLVPKAARILNKESSQYVKDKLLEIIASMCHIDKVIDRIEQDRELVNFIFCSFGKCSNNFRLQKPLCKLLSLIIHEIEFDATSEWMCHLTRFRYLLEPSILRLLMQPSPKNTDDMCIEILALVYSLSEVTLPDETNVLERFFNIRGLISALLHWFFQVFLRNFITQHFHNFIFIDQFWIIINLWQKIIRTVTKFESFRCNSCDYDNDVDRLFILQALNFVQHSFRLLLLFSNTVLQGFENIPPLSVVDLSQNIKLFSNSFSNCKITIKNLQILSNILNQIEFYIDQNAVLENAQGIKVHRVLQVMQDLEQYCERIVNNYEWTHKDILNGLLVWEYFSIAFPFYNPFTHDFLYTITTYNTSSNLEYKIMDLITSNTYHYLCASLKKKTDCELVRPVQKINQTH